MTIADAAALRVAGRLWLEEVCRADVAELRAVEPLVPVLPDSSELENLAVEHQRLFDLSLPPYESLFVDPSAMLEAPATERVRALFARAGWSPPPDVRFGAPDHVGLELMALADWIEGRNYPWAAEIVSRHLALWLPPVVIALMELDPHPFYAALGAWSRDGVLAQVPDQTAAVPLDPFPDLPAPPVYAASGPAPGAPGPVPSRRPEGPSLGAIVRRLLAPRRSGLYLSRAAIAGLAHASDLPVSVGDRRHMLTGLLRAAGQYDAQSRLGGALRDHVHKWDGEYATLATRWPAWEPYAAAWRARLATADAIASELRGVAADPS